LKIPLNLPLETNHYPQVSPWQAAHSIFFIKNQKMPEFANNMGWIFSGTKTKRSTRLTREKRGT